MSLKPVKENGHNGQVIQVFVPTTREQTNNPSVTFGNIVRFTADGAYEINLDGVRVPFTAGMTMGVPINTTSLHVYNQAGDTLTAQIVEVM